MFTNQNPSPEFQMEMLRTYITLPRKIYQKVEGIALVYNTSVAQQLRNGVGQYIARMTSSLLFKEALDSLEDRVSDLKTSLPDNLKDHYRRWPLPAPEEDKTLDKIGLTVRFPHEDLNDIHTISGVLNTSVSHEITASASLYVENVIEDQDFNDRLVRIKRLKLARTLIG